MTEPVGQKLYLAIGRCLGEVASVNKYSSRNGSPCRNVVGKTSKVQCNINRCDLDVGWDRYVSWSKIQDSLDADIHQFVGDVLSCIPRNSDYSQIDPSIL